MENKEIILVKNGEISLKGLNRNSFEDTLVRNLKWRLKKLGRFEYKKAQSTIYITPLEEGIDLDEACDGVGKVFGVAAYSRCLVIEKDMELIMSKGVPYLADILKNAKTFKVFAKRSDKKFPLESPQIQAEMGGAILNAYPHLKVDVKNPEVAVTVEIRDFAAYIHAGSIRGAGGMPVSSSGEGLLLISGGIDSPVAGYMMAKRGLKLSAIHFVSPPYTSDRALEKVETLLGKVSVYAGDTMLYCVPFTRLQEAIRDHCPEELFTIIMRRLMMKIAIKIADREGIPALITGESLAQVASQTIYALATTDAVSDRPVLRPLIGMDKRDIVDIAQEIDTFETSILPYEDCCTVFTPRRPKTKPTLKYVEDSEKKFDFTMLLEEAVAETTTKLIRMQR